MLEGLDSVDWSTFQHAHGPAVDVPRLLRSLQSSVPGEREEACADLHERVWHQGTIYPASAEIIPFLWELLSCENELGRGCAVSLLCCIATGTGSLHYGIRVDGEERIQSRLAKEGKSLSDALAEEKALLEGIRKAISLCLRDMIIYLQDTEGLAISVAEVLGLFPEHSSWSIPILNELLLSTSDEDLKQRLLESKTRLVTMQDHSLNCRAE